jgi:hypothetical protein
LARNRQSFTLVLQDEACYDDEAETLPRESCRRD